MLAEVTDPVQMQVRGKALPQAFWQKWYKGFSHPDMVYKHKQEAHREVVPENTAPGMTVCFPLIEHHERFKIRCHAARDQSCCGKQVFPPA